MLLNYTRISGFELAMLTRYRFLPGMLSQMNHMRNFPSRLMATHVAYERFDLIVHGLYVFRQNFRIGEYIVARAHFTFLLRIPTHFGAFVLVMCDAVHAKL